MIFSLAIETVKRGRRDANFLRGVEPTFYSVQHLDFTQGETCETLIFSGPATAFSDIEHFVACGIHTILVRLGYEPSIHADDTKEVEELLDQLRFFPPQDLTIRSLLEHLNLQALPHDLSYYDFPKVKQLALMGSWMCPASGGGILTSSRYHFMIYWYSTA